MTDDVFDRLKNRTRSTVPARDASLVKPSVKDELTEVSHSENEQNSHPVRTEISHITSTDPDPEPVGDLPEVTRRTIRLDKDIDTRLEQLCTMERITRDTFIEAAYLVCSKDSAVLQQILNAAKARYQDRKRAGDQRKFATMAKKYGQV